VSPYPALGVLAVNESIVKPAVGRSREPLDSAPQRTKRVPQDRRCRPIFNPSHSTFSDTDVWSACAEHQLQRSYTGQWLIASRNQYRADGLGENGRFAGSD
jgi:hypothetical protein